MTSAAICSAAIASPRSVPLPLVPGRSAHRGTPPRIGEHGREVLEEAGYAADAIAALCASGAVALPVHGNEESA